LSKEREGSARFGRVALGERLGGFIYGTIVVLSVVIAGAKAFPDEPERIAVIVAVTTFVFWAAHVYAHALAHSVSKDQHLSFSEFRRIARGEASILEAAVPPIVALLAGAIGLFDEDTAVWLAIIFGLIVLATQGFLFARVERLSGLATLVVVALNLGLGVVLIGMKLFVTHH
jgi:hypothetical protein